MSRPLTHLSPRSPGDLKCHLKNKHPAHISLMDSFIRARTSKEGKAFPCPIADCPSGYLRKKDLSRHLNAKHRGALAVAPEQVCSDDDPSYSSEN